MIGWRGRLVAGAMGVLGLCLVAAGASEARSAAQKPRLLPAVSRPSEALAYGSKRVLVASSKGITRLLRSNAIDRSFGTDGWVDIRPTAVRVLPSGKILVLSSGSDEPTLTRLLPSGDVDRRFGQRGIVSVDFGYRYNRALSMTLQAGKVVVAGEGSESVDSRTGELFGTKMLERFKPNGVVDHGFGDGGRLTVRLANRSDERDGVPGFASIQTLPGGGLLGTNDFGSAMVKLHPNGSPVTKFGEGGMARRWRVENGPGSKFLVVAPPLILPNGALVLFGSVSRFSNDVRSNTVATSRYGPNGRLDTSYGKGGYAVTRYRGSAFPAAAALRPDGKIVIAMSRQRPTGKHSRLGALVLRPNGRLDRSSAGHGEVTVAFGGWATSQSVVTRRGGRALLFGTVGATDQHPHGMLVAPVSLRARRGR